LGLQQPHPRAGGGPRPLPFVSLLEELSLKANEPLSPLKWRLPYFYVDLIQSIPCISKLRSSEISVRPGKAESFLAIKFECRVVEIPSMRYLFLNCVAFEQCHKSYPKHILVIVCYLLDFGSHKMDSLPDALVCN